MKRLLFVLPLIFVLTSTTIYAEDIWVVIQAPDGTLYLQRNGTATEIQPVPVTQDHFDTLKVSEDFWLDPPMHWEGTGATRSAPFYLSSGSYAVQWSVEKAGCYLYLSIRPGEEGTWYPDDIVSESLSQGAATKGSTYLYKVPSGMYYVDDHGTCGAWKLDAQRI